MTVNHFISLADESRKSLTALLDKAAVFKRGHKKASPSSRFHGKMVGMYFEKASLRTRLSFEVAVLRLGAQSTFETTVLGEREPLIDFANVASRYLDALVLRTKKQETIDEVARHATIPVINALSDHSHPCQGLADLLTIRQHCGELEGKRVVFIGDGNNVSRSLAIGCSKMGAEFILAAPAAYQFKDGCLDELTGCSQMDDVMKAVENTNAIYTDVWTSMGQEDESKKRRKAFAEFQVNSAVLSAAPKKAIVMHCLPAIRGEEISADVLDGPQSVIYDQAENRLHAQQAVLMRLLA